MVQYTAAQLKNAHKVQRAIESLQTKMDSLNHKLAKTLGGEVSTPHGKGISAAGRARIAAAQKLRWSKIKGKGGKAPTKTGRTMSAAARAKIAKAARARWAKAKASGKNRL